MNTREQLQLIGIRNGKEFAILGNAPAVIYFLARDKSDSKKLDHRAELHFFDTKGREDETKIFRPDKIGPVSLDRVQCVEQAQAYANGQIGHGPWSRTPYANSWVPSEHYAMAVEILKERLEE